MKPKRVTLDVNLLSFSMGAIMLAQFLSALADNALLFVAIALIKHRDLSAEHIPLLQEFFVFAFILLAPFVGPLADTFSKGRVMLASNSIKFFGASAMYIGLDPLVAYGIVGLGAAAYSPAKYGILRELVNPEKLVRANGLMEGSTIIAILIGVMLGGRLSDYSIPIALLTVILTYSCAAAANLVIPYLPPAHRLTHANPMILLSDFLHALKVLYRKPNTRFALLGASLFWGSGGTLRLLLVAWVPIALGVIDNNTPAMLNGVVAIGIAVGAGIASRYITIHTAVRVMPAGVFLGILVIILAQLHHLWSAVLVLITLGASGGFFVVPLNALIQESGHRSVGTGHAVAVQNFSDYVAILSLVGLYTYSISQHWSVISIAEGFGGLLSIGMLFILWSQVRLGKSVS